MNFLSSLLSLPLKILSLRLETLIAHILVYHNILYVIYCVQTQLMFKFFLSHLSLHFRTKSYITYMYQYYFQQASLQDQNYWNTKLLLQHGHLFQNGSPLEHIPLVHVPLVHILHKDKGDFWNRLILRLINAHK